MLAPVFAMRHDNDFGIGDTLAVREAIDFCAAHKLAVLQLLPIHETIGDHSPYNPISAHALSPALLALTEEEVPGLVATEVAVSAPESWVSQLRRGKVKYNSVQSLKVQLLFAAYGNFMGMQLPPDDPLMNEFLQFRETQAGWLDAYTLFRLLIREYEGNPNWMEWRPEHQHPETTETWLSRHPNREDLTAIRDAFTFIQWVGWRQWSRVRLYAEEKGVYLMGETSFGVSKCSADVWANPELFDPEWNMGTRPIAYFDTNKDSERWGQNWGLPAYRWENHRATKFAWLRGRIYGERQFFHICRLDHLRGYFRGYMFPWNGGPQHAEFAMLTEEEAKARTGGKMPRFVPGPDEDPVAAQMNDLQGREIISVLREAAGPMYLFAEIMGAMPEYMARALDDLAIPSLVFPQLERFPDRKLQSINSYRRLALASYANHDHAPLASYYFHLHEQAKLIPTSLAAVDLANVLKLIGWQGAPPEQLDDELLAAFQRTLFSTPCQLAVLMCSDVFGIPLRFNLPGSYGSDVWCDRLEFPFRDYETHPVYGPRLERMQDFVTESGRAENAGAASVPPPPKPTAPPHNVESPPLPDHPGVPAARGLETVPSGG